MEWSRQGKAAVKFIWNPKDFGSCRARNQGLKAAAGDIVLFLDNDVMLDDPGWLKELSRPVYESRSGIDKGSNEPPVVATAPLLLFPGISGLVQCAGGGVTAVGRVGLVGRASADAPKWAQEREIAWAPTAALLVSREALIKAGGFDEGFDPVSVCEDIDLCCRLRAGGGRILFVGASRLRHFEGITFNHLGYDKRTYWLRHMRVIKKRWSDVLTTGTLHDEEEILWRPVIKDYSDLRQPIVRLPSQDEQEQSLPNFFSPFLDVSQVNLPSLRLAVIGCGQAALRGAFPGFSPPGSEQATKAAPFLNFDGTPDVILAAVCDVDQSRAVEAARQFGVQRVETDDEHLLDDVPVEAICICSPPFVHARQSLAALRRGIPVLVEKPPVVSESELQEVLVEKSLHDDLPVMVNLPWSFHPAVEAVRKIISAGALGAIRRVEATFEHCGPQLWAPDAHWYREGGLQTLILDLGLHVAFTTERLFNSKINYLGLETITGRSEHAWAQCLIGAIDARFSVGWDAPKARFTFEIYGSEASLSINLIPWRVFNHPSAIQVKEGGRDWAATELTSGVDGSLWMPHGDEPFLGGPYRHFAECLKTGLTPITDLSIVANATRAVLRWAAESAEDK
jgi:predicted dehydrogenase/GT2 family glycosyltransferase